MTEFLLLGEAHSNLYICFHFCHYIIYTMLSPISISIPMRPSVHMCPRNFVLAVPSAWSSAPNTWVRTYDAAVVTDMGSVLSSPLPVTPFYVNGTRHTHREGRDIQGILTRKWHPPCPYQNVIRCQLLWAIVVSEKEGVEQSSGFQTLLPRTPRPPESSLGETSGNEREPGRKGFGLSSPLQPG